MITISEFITGLEKCKPLESLNDRNTLIIINDVLAILGAVILLIRALISLSSDLPFMSEKSSQ